MLELTFLIVVFISFIYIRIKRTREFTPALVLLIAWGTYLLCVGIFKFIFSLPDIGIKTSIYVISALLSFCIGDLILRKFKTKKYLYPRYNNYIPIISIIVVTFSVFFVLFQIYGNGFVLFDVINNSQRLAYVIRHQAINNLGKINFIGNIFELVTAIFIFFYYNIRSNFTNLSRKNKILFIFTLCAFLIANIFTAAKQNIINLFLMLIIIEVYLETKIYKIFYLVILFAVLLFIMIILLNNANLATTYDVLESIISIVKVYVCASLYGFDYVVTSNFNAGYNGGWLAPLYAILYRFGVVETYPITHMEFFNNAGIKSNIYTGLYAFYQNFGIVELIIMMFISGMLYKFSYIMFINRNLLFVLYFPMIMSSLIMSPINGSFFTQFVLFCFLLLRKLRKF